MIDHLHYWEMEEAWRIARQLATRERLLNRLIPPY
jgi:hypothetical protein